MNKYWLWVLCMCCTSLFVQAQSVKTPTLQNQLNKLLDEQVLRTSEVGISVFNLTKGQSVFRYQDEKLYRPASIEKIITSVTALAELGENYTLDTQLRTYGQIVNDTLKGTLYLTGALDPLFMESHMDSLVDAVVRQGIRHISDPIVADVSMKDSVYWGPGWSWDDTPFSFQPYLSPLMLNRGCVSVRVSPTQKDSLPRVNCTPASSYYQVLNQGISHHFEAGRLKVTRNWLHNGNQLRVSGNVEVPVTKEVNVYRPEDFFMHVFLEKLKLRGVEVSAYRHQCQSVAADSLQVMAVVHRPIREVLKEALKESDNLCAEAMFYHLAALRSWSKPVEAEDGTEAIYAFMTKALGMNPERYNIVDGSGVSLYNYVSPQLLVEYLKYAYYHRDIFLPFYESLPIAGIDGTLKHRMKNTKAKGNVHAKTGSVKGVSSLAGYVRAANGDMMAFVIINQNVMQLSKARAFQDKLCAILSRTL